MRPLAPLAVVYLLAAALLVPGSPLAAEDPAPPQSAPPAEGSTPPESAPAGQAPAADDPAAEQPPPEAQPPPGAETSTQPSAEPPVAAAAPPAEEPAPPMPGSDKQVAAATAGASKAAKRAPKARAAANGAVTIKDFKFSPAAVSVNVGDTVTWANRDSADHTATGRNFDTGTLSQGQSGSFTFREAGTFSYVCNIHPNMRGTVQVAAAGQEQQQGGEEPAPAPSEPSEPSASSGGPALPKTGGGEGWLAALGALLLVAGFAARRRTDAH